VILVRDRRAEQCHDPVAQRAAHRPFVAMHGFHHHFDRAIEKPLGLLDVQRLNKLGRTLDIGEQDGDLLSLALDHAPRCEDLFGQMRGRVGRRRGGARLHVMIGNRCRPGQLSTALNAEAAVRAVGVTAAGTRRAQTRAAGFAELGRGGVVCVTGCAAHSV
jgi:hypothetical protein